MKLVSMFYHPNVTLLIHFVSLKSTLSSMWWLLRFLRKGYRNEPVACRGMHRTARQTGPNYRRIYQRDTSAPSQARPPVHLNMSMPNTLLLSGSLWLGP